MLIEMWSQCRRTNRLQNSIWWTYREVSCVDRDVESVQENEQTAEVYLVDLQRGELC